MKIPWKKHRDAEVLLPLEGYNRWAGTYAAESNPIKDFSNKLIEKMLPEVPGKAVLDAGCGTGHFCKLLENRGAKKITGIDLSPAMVEEAKNNCPSAQIFCHDISTQPLDKDQFDIILCALVLGHIEDLKPALSNLFGSLKTGGSILISDFHPFLTLQHSKRTFQDAAGKLFEIQHHLHLFQDLVECFDRDHIVLERLEEPLWSGVPVIYALKGKKM